MNRMVMKRMMKNKSAMVGLCILVLIILACAVGPFLCRYGYNDMNLALRFKAPSSAHLLGTDGYGRDIFVRVLYGGRYSIMLGLCGAVFGLVIGVVFGLVDGYIGGRYDAIFMRIVDIVQSIPGLLLSITVAVTLGNGFFNTVLALAIGNVPIVIRLLRGSILSVRHEEYVEAAVSINASPLRIMFRHFLPNTFSPILVNTTMSIGMVVTQAAALSYLGLGVQPPNPEWGAMLTAGKDYITNYPWLVLYPGIAIAIFVLCVNLFGDGLRDAVDPKLKV